MNYYVEVVTFDEPEKVIERMGPMSEWKAEKVDNGVNLNLNHEDYYTRIVQDINLTEAAGAKK